MLGRHDLNPRLKSFARQLRKEPTDAERKLWALVRSRQLQGFRFRRQHPIGGYIVDLVALKQNLVIELDGGQHCDPAKVEYDTERTRELQRRGLRVLRIPDDEMLKNPGAVIETILRALASNGLKEPSP